VLSVGLLDSKRLIKQPIAGTKAIIAIIYSSRGNNNIRVGNNREG
jgi:hypothetical protein